MNWRVFAWLNLVGTIVAAAFDGIGVPYYSAAIMTVAGFAIADILDAIRGSRS